MDLGDYEAFQESKVVTMAESEEVREMMAREKDILPTGEEITVPIWDLKCSVRYHIAIIMSLRVVLDYGNSST